jgi:DNA-binding transcriptional LysR family regulator
MDLQHLQTVVDVARAGSFAAVARQQAMDPSLVSRAVAAAEGELGFRIFQRTTRALTLTEAGERYVSRLAHLLEELGSAKEQAVALSSEPKGLLRITTSVAFGHARITPLLPSFLQRHPEVQLDVLMTDAVIDLVAERVDVALRLSPRADSGYQGTQLARTHYRVVASPAYLKRAGPITAPEQLSVRQCLTFALPTFRNRWLFRLRAHPQAALQEVAIHPRVVVSNGLALLDLAKQGAGPSLLADWLVRDALASGELIDVLPQWEASATDFQTGVWALYPSRAFLPLKTRAFIDHVKAAFAPGDA